MVVIKAEPAASVETLPAPVVQPEVPGVFAFKDHKVRVANIDGEPWFVASDVCRVLGYMVSDRGIVNAAMATNHLHSDERKIIRRAEVSATLIPWGQAAMLILISESGLYKLVMRSDKPEAKAFQDWVTREVLPTIRKSGTYSVHDMPDPAETVAAPVRLLKSAFGIALNVLSKA